MPTYVYKCSACGQTWNLTRSIHDDTEVIHANCGMVAKRVPQTVGVLLKGPGFHKTDSRPQEDNNG